MDVRVRGPGPRRRRAQRPFTNTAAADGDDVDGDALAQATSDTTSVDIAHDSGTLAIVKSANVPTRPRRDHDLHLRRHATPRAPTARRPRTSSSPTRTATAAARGLDGFNAATPTPTGASTAARPGSGLRLLVPGPRRRRGTTILNTATLDGDDLDGDALTRHQHEIRVDIAHDSGTLAIVKSATDQRRPTATPSPTPSMSPTPRAPTARRPRTSTVTDADCDRAPAEVLRPPASTPVTPTSTAASTAARPGSGRATTRSGPHVDGELNDPFTNTAAADGDDVDGDALATGDTSEPGQRRHRPRLGHARDRQERPATSGRPTAAPSPTPSMSPTPRAPTARRPRTRRSATPTATRARPTVLVGRLQRR